MWSDYSLIGPECYLKFHKYLKAKFVKPVMPNEYSYVFEFTVVRTCNHVNQLMKEDVSYCIACMKFNGCYSDAVES